MLHKTSWMTVQVALLHWKTWPWFIQIVFTFVGLVKLTVFFAFVRESFLYVKFPTGYSTTYTWLYVLSGRVAEAQRLKDRQTTRNNCLLWINGRMGVQRGCYYLVQKTESKLSNTNITSEPFFVVWPNQIKNWEGKNKHVRDSTFYGFIIERCKNWKSTGK